MTCAFGQTFQTFILVDLHFQIQGRNAQCTEAAVRVVEPVRKGELAAGVGGLTVISGRIVDTAGSRTDIATGCAGIGGDIQRYTGSQLIGLRTAEGGRHNRRILAAVDVVPFRTATHHDHLINRGGRCIQRIIRRGDVILQRQCRGQHQRCHYRCKQSSQDPFLHRSYAPFCALPAYRRRSHRPQRQG